MRDPNVGDWVRGGRADDLYEVVSGPWASGGAAGGPGEPYFCCLPLGGGETIIWRIEAGWLRVVRTAEERVAEALMGGAP